MHRAFATRQELSLYESLRPVGATRQQCDALLHPIFCCEHTRWVALHLFSVSEASGIYQRSTNTIDATGKQIRKAAKALTNGSSALHASERCRMPTLTVAAQKGGSGKITAASNLAVRAVQCGVRAVLVDIDPQLSAYAWAARRAKLLSVPVDEIAMKTTAAELSSLRPRLDAAYELVLIDTPATLGIAVDPALAAADFVVVPCRPTFVDLESALSTARAIHAHNRRFAFLLTQCPPDSPRVTDAEAMLDRLGAKAGHRLGSRVAYQDALATGRGVTESPFDSPAGFEVNDLWRWVAMQLWPGQERF